MHIPSGYAGRVDDSHFFDMVRQQCFFNGMVTASGVQKGKAHWLERLAVEHSLTSCMVVVMGKKNGHIPSNTNTGTLDI